MHDCLKRELKYRTSKSSGPGGQHVNKTESRVELLWVPDISECLNSTQLSMVCQRLKSRITDEGVLILASEKYRSQYRNREEVTKRFLDLVQASLVPVKRRRPTKPSRSSVEKRIKNKKIRGDVKRSRRNRSDE